ncbi:MAG: C45 family autoproteolytic acyltransferase/hydrolase [Planctomycetota bacterium]
MPLPRDHLPGPPADAGYRYGTLIPHLFQPAFHEAYLGRLAQSNRFERGDLAEQARRWLGTLPANFQEEIDGMASGARVPLQQVTEFLYADIAHATRTTEAITGPLCSGVITTLDDATWVARNCDWLSATLMRGTAAVTHAVPNRIPVTAVGIRGDIELDTGINAEQLWLHLHTLLAMDDPPRDRTCISWLFWAREALEQSASLDDLERFIESTGRDRGVIAIAVDGKAGEGAVFECTKSDHKRFDFDPKHPMFATNHPQEKIIDDARESKARAGSTVARYCALRRSLNDHPPEHGPDDLVELLASDGVEMRTPTYLRTIYSAACDPASDHLWFASGTEDGKPAASTGRWERVPLRW